MSTGRVNDPASTTSPASRYSPWAASRSTSQATPLAGWLRTPAAMPVSSIWPLRNNSAPIQRRSKSSGRIGRPPTTNAAFAALSEIVSITAFGVIEALRQPFDGWLIEHRLLLLHHGVAKDADPSG